MLSVALLVSATLVYARYVELKEKKKAVIMVQSPENTFISAV